MRALTTSERPGGLLRKLRAWLRTLPIGTGYRPERHYMRGQRLPGTGAG
jgi:hypothetical protein